jgi:hypothetical protein
MALPDLAPVITSLEAWARAHHVSIGTGTVELSETLPTVTVQGYDSGDIELFLMLADQLKPKVVALDARVFGEGELELARAFTGRIADIEARAAHNRRLIQAQDRLGEVHDVKIYAFAPGLERVLVYTAVTDWGDELFSVMRDVIREAEE